MFVSVYIMLCTSNQFDKNPTKTVLLQIHVVFHYNSITKRCDIAILLMADTYANTLLTD